MEKKAAEREVPFDKEVTTSRKDYWSSEIERLKKKSNASNPGSYKQSEKNWRGKMRQSAGFCNLV